MKTKTTWGGREKQTFEKEKTRREEQAERARDGKTTRWTEQGVQEH